MVSKQTRGKTWHLTKSVTFWHTFFKVKVVLPETWYCDTNDENGISSSAIWWAFIPRKKGFIYFFSSSLKTSIVSSFKVRGELINEVTIFTRVCNDATDSSSEATKRFNFSPVPLIFISCMRFRNTVVELRLMAREVKEKKKWETSAN